MDWLPWAPLAAASLHMCEEFLLPGGFPAWYRRYTPNPSRITNRFLLIINGLLLAVCWNLSAIARTPWGALYWLAIVALLAVNGCWHLFACCRSHTYSPGTVTGMTLYVPLAVYGYYQFVRSGNASLPAAIVALLIGGSYQFWDAVYFRRVGKKPAVTPRA